MTITLPPSVREAIDQGSLPAALQAILQHFGCQAGTIHFLREGVLKLEVHAGIPPHIAQIVETVPIGKGIAGLAAERRGPVTICNLQTDTSGQAKPAARATGMEGSVAVPILAPDGALRGVLGIAKSTAHDWTAEETDLLTAIAAALPG